MNKLIDWNVIYSIYIIYIEFKNPHKISKILNMQLSASSLSSHKWRNYSALNRILSYKVVSPDISSKLHD